MIIRPGRACKLKTDVVEHRAVVPITLKAGRNVSAAVTVVGRQRAVGLMLKDPTGKILGSSKMDPRTARIRAEEVNANGTCTMEVYSDLIGRRAGRRRGRA